MVLLGLHLTALVAIVGSFATTVAVHWTIFLIPLESSLIGLWYMDHAVMIEQIAYHLQTSTESNVAGLTGEARLLWWETRHKQGITNPTNLPVGAFRRLLPVTFLAPSLTALAASSILLTVSLSDSLAATFAPELIFRGASIGVAFVVWLVNAGLTGVLISMFVRRSKISDARKHKARETLSQTG